MGFTARCRCRRERLEMKRRRDEDFVVTPVDQRISLPSSVGPGSVHQQRNSELVGSSCRSEERKLRALERRSKEQSTSPCQSLLSFSSRPSRRPPARRHSTNESIAQIQSYFPSQLNFLLPPASAIQSRVQPVEKKRCEAKRVVRQGMWS